MDKDTIGGLVNKMGLMLSERQWRLAAAESCTGGWLSKVCTDQAGSSAWFESAVVCYDNRVKRSLLEVPASVLDQHGAVSEATALAMARGVLRLLPAANISIAVSGIAGPDGGSDEKPVGTVCFAACCPSRQVEKSACEHFAGDRKCVRQSSVLYAVRLILATAQDES